MPGHRLEDAAWITQGVCLKCLRKFLKRLFNPMGPQTQSTRCVRNSGSECSLRCFSPLFTSDAFAIVSSQRLAMLPGATLFDHYQLHLQYLQPTICLIRCPTRDNCLWMYGHLSNTGIHVKGHRQCRGFSHQSHKQLYFFPRLRGGCCSSSCGARCSACCSCSF